MSIQPFDFRGHQVRVFNAEDGEPRFVLNDLCAVLEIGNPRNVRARLDQECVHQADVLDGRGLLRPTTVVDESGMYEVILRSDKPEAVEFRRWITREVLPAIRKHGGYLTQEKIEDVLADPDTIIQLATSLKDERARRAELETRAAEDAPKVQYHDKFVADEDLIQFRTLANQLEIGEQELRRQLAEHGWIYNDRTQRWSNKANGLVWESRWRCASDKKRYFRLIPHHKAPRINGEVRQTLKITPAGATAITRAVSKWARQEVAQEAMEIRAS